MATRLTDRGIRAIKPTDRSMLYYDSEVSGLALRVYSSGIKSFCFDYREFGRQRRITLGRFPLWTIGRARLHAGKMRLKVDTGESIAPARGVRVDSLIAQWRAVVAITKRPNTIRSYNHALDAYILPAFGRDDPKGVTSNRIEAWHGAIAQRTPEMANRALAVLSAFLSWLERDRKVERNEAKRVKRRPESARQVFLDANEIIAALAALDADPHRRPALALKLALLSGARIGEVVTLAPDQLDGGRKLWIKPASLTKQKRVHVTPLSGEAVAVARELLALGLPSYDQCHNTWRRVRKLIGREDATIHDLRHSRASALARSGASLPQIGRLLGHASPSTTQRYLHLVDRDLIDLVERS